MKPECPDCHAHDVETGRLVEQIFSRDEVSVLGMLVAQALKMNTETQRAMKPDDLQRLVIQRNLDFMSQMLGKLMVSFDQVYKAGFLRQLKRSGVSLDIQHAPCPHQPRPTPAPDEIANQEGGHP